MPENQAMPLYASHTLRQIEAHFSEQALMQRAGAAAAEWATELSAQQDAENAQPILILAGPGNNGGDALEAAYLLHQRFFKVCVVFTATPENLPTDARAAYQRFISAGGQTCSTIPTETPCSLIIDGLFGIGLTRPPEGVYAEWISQAQALAARDRCPLLALDCPSGLNADTGNIQGKAIIASHTLTFISGKPGLLTAEGPDHCGEIRIAALGLNLADAFPPDGRQVSPQDFAVNLKKRAKNTHKGTFGNVGILGGGPSMLGAALLAGRAALKMGAGKVYLGLLDAHAPSVDLLQPELMLRHADTLLDCELHALACGPGLGQSAEAAVLLEQALKAALPLLLDADALNILAGNHRLQEQLLQRHHPAILTPHPAEAARLLGYSVPEVQANRIAAAGQISRNYNAHVVLKGCGSVLAAVDGRWWINSTGNPGMASAGMGDVLSGLIVALLAQGWSAESALLGGVYLHGAAADNLVVQGTGPIGLSAGEVIDAARQHLNTLTNLPQIGLC